MIPITGTMDQRAMREAIATRTSDIIPVRLFDSREQMERLKRAADSLNLSLRWNRSRFTHKTETVTVTPRPLPGQLDIFGGEAA